MFIDTAVANSRSARPHIIISPHPAPHTEHETPLLETFVGQEPAPPTYLEATTPGLYYSRTSGDEGARLLSGGGRELREPVFKESVQKAREAKKRWIVWMVVLFVAVIMIMVVVAAAAMTRNHHIASAPKASAQAAEDKPNLITVPWPGSVAKPPSPTQEKKTFPIRWPSRCGKQYNVKTEDYDFGAARDIKIHEAVNRLDGPYKRIMGWVHVAQAPTTQAAGTIQSRVSYAVSPSVDINSIKYMATSTGLTIGDPSIPDSFKGISAGSACLGMSIVLYMAPGATLETFDVISSHLGMQVHGGATFSVTNKTSISLGAGTLDSVAFDSRETYLQTTSGSVSGAYSLSNLVSVNTKSGSVNIDIVPKPATEGISKQALFSGNSHSGSMRVDFQRKHIPERDYQLFLNTTVGSVDGTFIHGSKTEINSVAGSVKADILPYGSGAVASLIETSTHSGQMSIKLRSPYKGRGVPMTALTSTHKSVSGAVDLSYPKEWQGYINGTTMSGSLHLQGKGLELLNENDEPGSNHVEAKKGNGGSTMKFDTISGGCEITIGKV